MNDEELMLAPNLLLLLVSATPYNVLTCNSRVNQQPDEAGAGNVVRWFQSGEKAETEYRSMDFYLDTVAFEVPPGLKARLRVQDGSDPPMEITLSLDVANGQGSASPPLRIASMTAIADLLNASLVQQGVKKTLLVVKFSHKTEPSLRYKFYLHRPNAPMKKTTVTLVFDEHSLWKLLGFTEEGPKELFQGDDKHDDKLIAKGDITVDSQSPNALQRIRADEGFKVLHEAFLKKFGSRTKRGKDGEAKCGTKNGGAFRPCHTLAPFFSLQFVLILERRFFRLHRAEPFAYQDGHMLVCEYLISLVYFATFRINHHSWREPGHAILVPLSESKQFISDPEYLERFRSNLDLVCQREEGHLQYDLRAVKNVMCSKYLEQAKRELKDEGKDSTDEAAYAYWIDGKFEAEKLAAIATDDLSWFNGTDGIVKSLLDQTMEGGCAHGRMAIMRVYEKDENLSMQKMLRTALDKLGLGGPGQRRAFSVICDVGDTKLFSHVEAYFLDHDLRRPVRLQAGDKPPALVDRKGKPLKGKPLTLRTIFEARKEKVPGGGAELRYEDLYNLPCLVILCEKGRQGDTFPHSLETLDFRLRTSGSYSAFIQELGRMCRYPATRPLRGDPLKGDQGGSYSVRAVRDEGDKELKRQVGIALNETTGDLIPAAAFRFALLIRCEEEGTVAGVACNLIQLRSIINDDNKLRPEQHYLIEIYLDQLPQALVRDDIHQKLVEAVDWKQKHVPSRTHPHIAAAECIVMPDGLDPYIKGDQSRMKELLPTAEDKDNPLHKYEHYEPDPRNPPTEKPHYDIDNKPREVHERRIVLFAECQIGKTGAYLHLLSTLRNEVQAGYQDIVIEQPITTRTWHFPCAPPLLSNPPPPLPTAPRTRPPIVNPPSLSTRVYPFLSHSLSRGSAVRALRLGGPDDRWPDE